MESQTSVWRACYTFFCSSSQLLPMIVRLTLDSWDFHRPKVQARVRYKIIRILRNIRQKGADCTNENERSIQLFLVSFWNAILTLSRQFRRLFFLENRKNSDCSCLTALKNFHRVPENWKFSRRDEPLKFAARFFFIIPSSVEH